MPSSEADPSGAARRTDWSLPSGWEGLQRSSWGPFVVRELARRPDGSVVELTSRRHRKQLSHRVVNPATRTPEAVLWAPRLLGWWVGVLFMVGSACFVLGSVPWYASATSPTVVAATYFVGSLFFTSAAYGQFHQAAHPTVLDVGPRQRTRWWRARSLGWWASAVQLVGTVFFNATTFAALQTDFSLRQQELRIWSPDFFGSICFLVASWFACEEVRSADRSWRVRWADVGWRIAWLNMWGSIFFMASALAAFVVPDTGDLLNAVVANAGTFLGAVCFFLGARLLLVELGDQPN